MKLTERALKFLCLVGTFGHLTNRDAAKLLLADMSDATALVTAQNLGKRLAEDGLVLVKTLPLDRLSKVYVLTQAGSGVLNEQYIEKWLESDAEGAWFADGYSLSFNDNVTRRPLIQLLHDITKLTGWLPVGQRGMKRGFLKLNGRGNFDAALMDPETGKTRFMVYLAHPSTNTATRHVCKLAQGKWQFVIAAHNDVQLQALRRWRELTHSDMHNFVRNELPPGVLA